MPIRLMSRLSYYGISCFNFFSYCGKLRDKKATQTINILEEMRQPKKIGSNFGAIFLSSSNTPVSINVMQKRLMSRLYHKGISCFIFSVRKATHIMNSLVKNEKSKGILF